MAFNPFTSFRKYQKFWMASILLMTMVTFVLCSGLGGGDLGDRIIKGIGARRGNAMAVLDGSKIYHQDLVDLKEQRLVADKFLRKSMEIFEKEVSEQLRKLDPKKATKEIARLTAIQQTLVLRLQKKQLFETGTKLPELLDFLMWRNLADRYGIELQPDIVAIMVRDEMGLRLAEGLFRPEYFQAALNEVRSGGGRNINLNYATDALRDEFRVRIAKLAAAEAQLLGYLDPPDQLVLKVPLPISVRAVATPQELWEFYKKNRAEADVAIVAVQAQDFLDKVGTPTKEQIEDLFNRRREKVYDPTSDESGLQSPQKVMIEWIMGDPKSPFYQTPAKVIVLAEMGIMAAAPDAKRPLKDTQDDKKDDKKKDDKKKDDKDFGHHVFPVCIPNAWLPLVARYAAGPAAMDTALRPHYLQRRDKGEYFHAIHPNRDTQAAPIHLSMALIAQKTKTALDANSLMQVLAFPYTIAPVGAVFAVAVQQANQEFAATLEEQNKARKKMLLTLAARVVARDPQLLGIPAIFDNRPTGIPLLLDPRSHFEWSLPLAQVKEELIQSLRIDPQASRWVNENMDTARAELELVQGKETKLKNRVDTLVSRFGLERNKTADYYDSYNIQKAPELAPLLASYKKYYKQVNFMEDRSGQSELKDDQFYRLFFGDEPFSVATRDYFVRPWPPDVTGKPPRASQRTTDLSHEEIEELKKKVDPTKPNPTISFFRAAEKPILFWKTAEKKAAFPDKLDDESRERVVSIWKLEEARDKQAWPRAKEIAQTAQKVAAVNLNTFLKDEAKKLKREPLTITGVANLVPFGGSRLGFGHGRLYEDFGEGKKVPRDKFDFPRDDLSKQILALVEGQKPIETKNAAIDEFNATLFKENKDLEKHIQILTNKPRTHYYVAVVTNPPTANRRDFEQAYVSAASGQFRDEFIDRAQKEIARQFMEELTRQLREQSGLEITASQDDRKAFE